MIKKILIANRGEIAIRIAKTCKEMDIKSVGIYSKEDKNSFHLDFCDEKYLLGDNPLKGSYLNIKKIISIAKGASVDAIHPGYGFLSENSDFVRKLENEKIIFIGPSYSAIKLMGDKIESKKIARKAGVNCIPGYEEAISDIKQGIKFAKKIGFPVMIKASAGGGGKGMRIAWGLDDFEDLVETAKNEADNAFGDDRVFIEKYIEKPRHIEMQIIGDKFGKIVWLGERECSIQRRHQKIIEEAPSSFIDETTRKKMGEQAVTLAKEVGYFSAGTVEFVVNQNREFFFLEMNTRLQVEHPVTELVTGIDLVEQMINIANNNKLDIEQKNISVEGWSFEARLCAENPNKNFVPSAGRLQELKFPRKNIRIDAGYQAGDEVSIYYDSLIAKIISIGKDRKEAIKKMQLALQQINLKGIDSNLDFLMDIYKKKSFVSGDIDTNYVSDNYKGGYKGVTKDKKELEVMALIAFCYNLDNLLNISKAIKYISKDWIIRSLSKEKLIKIAKVNANKLTIIFEQTTENLDYQVDYISSKVKIFYRNNEFIGRVKIADNNLEIFYNGSYEKFLVLKHRSNQLYNKLPKKKDFNANKRILSPMPGKVTKVLVKNNNKITIGDNLIILDAMKMENIIKADFDGKVKEVHIKENDSVSSDQLLISFY